MKKINHTAGSIEIMKYVSDRMRSNDNKRFVRDEAEQTVRSLLEKTMHERRMCIRNAYDLAQNCWSNGSTSNMVSNRSVAGTFLILIRKEMEAGVDLDDVIMFCKMFRLKKERDERYANLLVFSGSVDSAIRFIEDREVQQDLDETNALDPKSWARDVKDNLKDFRLAVRRFGEQLSSLDQRLSEDSVRIGFEQLLEVFNLLADIRDSIMAKDEVCSEIQKNRLSNITSIQDMIVDYLTDYGLTEIFTADGERYSGKYHTMFRKPEGAFDPDQLVIEKSVRKGFKWGETVIQKEVVCVR